jgi:hypothetical protein
MTANELKEKIKDWLRDRIRILEDKIKIDKKLMPQYKWSPVPDIYIPLDEDTGIFIEIENKQQHPDSNVVKYWWWMELEEAEHRQLQNQLKKVILIQVFGEQFRGVNLKLRIDLCKFLAIKMANNLPCVFHYHGFKGELEDAFEKIKSILKVYIREQENSNMEV